MKIVSGALMVVLIGACSNNQQAPDLPILRPSDCKNHTEWSEEDKTCVCSWGWTGDKCNIWGKSKKI
jgi:hypothetical protein